MGLGVGRVQPGAGAGSASHVGGNSGATAPQKRQGTIALIEPVEAFKTVERIQNLVNGLGVLGPLLLRMFGGGPSEYDVLRAKGSIPAWLGKDEFEQGLSAIRDTGVRPKNFLALGVEARGQFLRSAADFYRTWKDGRMTGRTLEHNMRELVASTEAGEEWRKTPGLNPSEAEKLAEAFERYGVTDPDTRKTAARNLAGDKTFREVEAWLAESGATTNGGGRQRPPGQNVTTADWPDPESRDGKRYLRYFEQTKEWGWLAKDIPSGVHDPQEYFKPQKAAYFAAEFAKRNGIDPDEIVTLHDGFEHLLQPGNELSDRTNLTDVIRDVLDRISDGEEAIKTVYEDYIGDMEAELADLDKEILTLRQRMQSERNVSDKPNFDRLSELEKSLERALTQRRKDHERLQIARKTVPWIVEQIKHNAALNNLSPYEFEDALNGPKADQLLFQRPRDHPLEAKPK